MIIDTDNVLQLPVKPKKIPDEERQFHLVEARQSPCKHLSKPVIIDETLMECVCAECGETLNPVWVLAEFARAEGRWHRARQQLTEARAQHEKRCRTKCKHCGEMTPISRN